MCVILNLFLHPGLDVHNHVNTYVLNSLEIKYTQKEDRVLSLVYIYLTLKYVVVLFPLKEDLFEKLSEKSVIALNKFKTAS